MEIIEVLRTPRLLYNYRPGWAVVIGVKKSSFPLRGGLLFFYSDNGNDQVSLGRASLEDLKDSLFQKK